MFRRILLVACFCLLGITGYSQDAVDCLDNIGFENGTLKDTWKMYAGRIDVDGTYAPFELQTDTGRYEIIRKGTFQKKVDDYGGFSLLSPNGSNNVIKLGDEIPRQDADKISYTINVPSNVDAYAITFYYAVVLENPGHEIWKQPRFTVSVFDETTKSTSPCATFNFIAPGSSGGGIPGFAESSVGDSVLYKPWSPVLVNLTKYLGHRIRLEFTVNDCTEGGHFGYAYIDIVENCATPITGNITCPEINSITLTSFPGFAEYRWYNVQDPSIIYGRAEKITLSPVPPVGTKIALELVPHAYSGGCVETMYTTIKNMEPLKVSPAPVTCLPFIDLTAKHIVAGNRRDLTYTYWYDDKAQNPVLNPKNVPSGTYYIMGTLPSGCFSIVPVNCSIVPLPPVTIDPPKPVAYPATVDLSSALRPEQGMTYTFWKDRDAQIELLAPGNIRVGGTYYIKGENSQGCTVITAVEVDINMPDIVIPNTFTPNGDGVNDLLTILLDSRIRVKSFRIFTRWGQQVFATSDINEFWNGNTGNNKVPSGTYYWMLEGDENSRRYLRKGSITVLR